MFKKADITKKNKIKAMYERIFDDPEAFVKYYFDERFDAKKVTISEDENGDIISMLSRNAKHLSVCGKTFKADYIYAVAVDENHRGKGISKNMVNKALELSEKEGTWFSYLIPVNAAIYEGNGFVSVRESKNVLLGEENQTNECENDGYSLEVYDGSMYTGKYKETLINELTEYCSNNKGNYEDAAIVTYRDEKYFEVMLRQYYIEKSQIAILRRNILENGNQIVGFAVINGEKEIIVCDYMCEEQCENILADAIKKHFNIERLIFKCNPIMVKITNPMFFTLLNSKENGKVNIKIKETGKIYSITGNNGKIAVCEVDKDYDVETSLEELTRYIFNMIEITEMIKINHLVGIAVNEEV